VLEYSGRLEETKETQHDNGEKMILDFGNGRGKEFDGEKWEI
jgi:hypothetical protein